MNALPKILENDECLFMCERLKTKVVLWLTIRRCGRTFKFKRSRPRLRGNNGFEVCSFAGSGRTLNRVIAGHGSPWHLEEANI